MGFDNENLDLLWEKEEQKKDSFAFEGEEFEFQEVTSPAAASPQPAPPAEARPAQSRPAVPKTPAEGGGPFGDLAAPPPVHPRPSSPIPLEPPSPTKAAIPTKAAPKSPLEEVFAPPPDLEPRPVETPGPLSSAPAGGLELEPVSGPGAKLDLEPAPLSVEKLERQIQAARMGLPQERPVSPPPQAVTAAPSAFREIVIPVTLSPKDFESAQKGELVIKLKIKIEP